MSIGFTIALFLTAASAGFVGSLTGLGGGIIVIPVLSLVFGVDFHYAAGAGLVTVIATSSGGAVRFLSQGLADVRIGMFLEMATAMGAIGGAAIAGMVSGPRLSAVFGVVVLVAGAFMLFRRKEREVSVPHPDRLARSIGLYGEFRDPSRGRSVAYASRRTPVGFTIMAGAGILSGMLGIGAGVFKVPAMDTAMELPIKISTATSNLMMGVTASAGAAVYLVRGDINPVIAGPVAVGVLLGARVGSRVLPSLKSETVRTVFVALLALVAIRMILEGIG